MGKTVSALTAESLLQTVEGGPALVLAPRRVALFTWPEEVAKWEHLRGLDVSPVVGTEAQRLKALKFDAPIYSANYDVLPWLVETLGDRWPFRRVYADESTKLKSYRGAVQTSKLGNEFVRAAGGKRARALGKIARGKVDRFVELTGTPSPNGLIDLWGQMWFLDHGQRLGRTFEAFKQRWFRPSFDGYGLEPAPHAMEEIQAALRDLCLTLDPRDYFDLREPIVSNVEVDLPPKARDVYREMEKKMFAEIEGHGVEAFNAAARTIKCLQIANGAAYIDDASTSGEREWRAVHDAKLEALEDVVEEAGGAPVLVAYHFQSDRERIKRTFKNVLDLGTDDGLRDAKRGRGRVWLGHPASMGHGVDGLQEHCNIGCFFGHWWNLEERLQFVERIGPVRQLQAGKDRPVYLYNIVARGTVDELVLERVNSKRSVQEILLAAMKKGAS